MREPLELNLTLAKGPWRTLAWTDTRSVSQQAGRGDVWGTGTGLRFFWSCEPGAQARDGVGVGRGQGTGDRAILFREERRLAAAMTVPRPEMGHFALHKLLQ